MFLYVIFYLQVVLRHRALELHHHRGSGDHFTAQRCAEAADVPVCAHLASPLGGRAFMALRSLIPLFDPVLLSLLLSGTETNPISH